MGSQQSNTGNPRIDLEYRRKKNAEEMKYQFITFALMIFLTIIAFLAVTFEGSSGGGFSGYFIAPFIFLLAIVQVIFQLYYFMHMSHRGHEQVTLFMFSGVLIAFITILTFVTIVWI